MTDDIEGVSLQTFAKLAVRLTGKPPEEWDAIAAEYGIAAGRFQAVSDAWTARFQTEFGLVNQYNDAYQAAMVEAGITAPEITLEQYVDLLKTGGPTPENLAKYAIDLQQFSMISNHWTQAMGSDVALAQRFAALYTAGG